MAAQTNSQQIPGARYIPVAIFDQYYPWPTPQSMRNRYYCAKRGTDPDFLKCIRRIGGRVLIDEAAFLQWLKQQADEHEKIVAV